MKNIIFFTIVFTLWAHASDKIIATAEAVKLLEQTELVEGGSLYCKVPYSYRQLGQWIQGRSLEVTREFINDPSKEKLVPNLVALSACNSSDEEFLQVSVEILNAFAEGKVNDAAFRVVIMGGAEKNGILDVNYRNERVASALRACLHKLPQDDPFAGCIRDTLSGQGAKNVLDNQGKQFPRRYEQLAEDALKSSSPSNALPARRGVIPPAGNRQTIGQYGLWWLFSLSVLVIAWFGFRYWRNKKMR